VLALVAGRLTNHPVILWEQAFSKRQVRASGSLKGHRLKSHLIVGARRGAYRWAPGVAVTSREVGAAVVESLNWLDVGRIHQLPNPSTSRRSFRWPTSHLRSIAHAS
jgi:hypothetical protein